MPAEREQSGEVTLERAFGSPTGLSNERVFLVVEGLHGAKLTLNTNEIRLEGERVDVTDALLSRNKIVVTTGGPFFTSARLEICEPT